MSSKGGTTVEKRLSTSKARKIFRKEKKFTIHSNPGTHKRKISVPLGFVLRDLLKVCWNLKEAKSILNAGKVKIDGKIRKEYKFPIGLFDVVSIEGLKSYRTLFDSLGRIELVEIDSKKEKLSKVCKIAGKRIVRGKVLQINTTDGRVFGEKAEKVSVGDSVLIDLAEQKIVSTIELKQGNLVYVFGGTHVGTVALVKNVVDGTMKRPKLLTLEKKDKSEFQTTENNVIVVGEKKPEVEVLKF